jgi:hypothetical protein
MPESPRYQVQVQGKAERAAAQMTDFTGGQVNGNGAHGLRHQMGLRVFLTNRRWLIMLAGTAGTWFLLDYAYYGNTISTPQILSLMLQPPALPQAAVPRLVCSTNCARGRAGRSRWCVPRRATARPRCSRSGWMLVRTRRAGPG